MQELNRIVKSGLLFILGTVYTRLIGLIYRIICARIGKEEYGLFSLGLMSFEIISVLSLFGLNFGLIRFLSYYKAKNDSLKVIQIASSVIKMAFFLSIIFAGGFSIISKYLSIFIFKNLNLIVVLRIFILAIPFWTLGTILLSIPIAFKEIKYFIFIRNLIEPSIKFGLALVLVSIGFGLSGLVNSFFTAQIISFILAVYLFKKILFPINLKLKMDWEPIKYSLPLGLGSILWIIFISTDKFMLGYLKNVIQVGVYNAASPLTQILFIFPQALSIIFLPVITALYAQEKEIQPIYKNITRWIFYTNLPLALLMIFFSKEIISLFFGRQYLAAEIPLIILTLGSLIASFSFTHWNILLVKKKTHLCLLNNFFSTITNFILNFYLIPLYGLIGAAIATTISLIICTILTVIPACKLVQIRFFSIDYLRAILSGLSGLGVLLFLRIFNFWSGLDIYRLVVGSILFLFIYILGLSLLKGIKKEDRELFKNWIEKLRRFNYSRQHNHRSCQ